MGAEDFSYMLEKVPGAMVMLGNGGGRGGSSLHNPRYDFNDMAIPFGVSFFVRTVERFLERAGMSTTVIPSAARDLSWGVKGPSLRSR